MNDYRYIYDELTTPFGGRLPTFPEACPKCAAPATAHGNRFHPVTYACGGAYDEKPQIQNHTDVWWGRCPATRAQEAE
jgi:hypothetical protein